MKRSIIILFTLAIITFTLNSVAQQRKELAVEKANDRLEAVINHLKNLKSIAVNFQIEIQDGSDKTIATQKGSAKVKDEKYELVVGSQRFYSNGKTLWIYNEMMQEVQINNYQKDEGSMFDMETLFLGKIERKLFKSKFNQEVTLNGEKCEEIEMTPIDKTQPFFKVLLWVSPKSYTIEKAKVFDKTGIKYLYTTKKIEKNIKFDSNFGQFIVAHYPDIEVVDLR